MAVPEEHQTCRGIKTFVVVLASIDVGNVRVVSVSYAYSPWSQLRRIIQSSRECLTLVVWGLRVDGIGRKL
jgi:hypothetical protein